MPNAVVPNLGKDRPWILVLLVLAALHCSVSMYLGNVSILSLRSYAEGTERLPYQYRTGMVPVLRAAEHSPLLNRMCATLAVKQKHGGFGDYREPFVPEKLVSMVIGVVSMLCLVAVATWYARRHDREVWWAGGSLLLVIFYVSYAARSDANFWYPYDLPHFALFGAASLAILSGSWLTFLVFFLIDVPVRETGIFLLPAVLLIARHRGELRRGLLVTAAALAAWVPFRVWVTHRYASNPTELGAHWSHMLHTFTNPLHWPQTASALGFLVVPLWLGRARLTQTQRLFIYAALPGLVVTLYFGVWFESRIFDEWALVVAVMLTRQFHSLIREYSRATGWIDRDSLLDAVTDPDLEVPLGKRRRTVKHGATEVSVEG